MPLGVISDSDRLIRRLKALRALPLEPTWEDERTSAYIDQGVADWLAMRPKDRGNKIHIIRGVGASRFNCL